MNIMLGIIFEIAVFYTGALVSNSLVRGYAGTTMLVWHMICWGVVILIVNDNKIKEEERNFLERNRDRMETCPACGQFVLGHYDEESKKRTGKTSSYKGTIWDWSNGYTADGNRFEFQVPHEGNIVSSEYDIDIICPKCKKVLRQTTTWR